MSDNFEFRPRRSDMAARRLAPVTTLDGISRGVVSGQGARRYRRFKASLRGRIEYSGSSYLCLVQEISERGVQVLSVASANVGDRMRFSLQVSQDVQLSCVIEIRHVDSDGFLGAKIVDISGADAEALSRLIDDYFAAARA